MDAPDTKTCNRCGEAKPLELFAKASARKDGRSAWCKACQSAYAKARYDADPEKFRKAGRDRMNAKYAADPEPIKAARRAWYAENKEKSAEGNRRWVASNPEKSRAIKRKYWLANPDVTRAAIRRRRARRANNGVESYREQDIYERDGGKCVHCHAVLPVTPRSGWHLDHIVPISLGGPDTAANVQLSCPACNWTKSARLEGQVHFAV